MRFQRQIVIASVVAATLLFGNLVGGSSTRQGFSESYPPVLCPDTFLGESRAISLPSTQTGIRELAQKSIVFKPARTLRLIKGGTPLIVDAKNMTAPVWQTKSGTWGGATICSSPQTSQWFIGGAADVTSRGRLVVVNSGLSEAIVDLKIWSQDGARPDKVLTLKANSSTNIRLNALDPGSAQLAIHVSPRSGRVNAFMFDERGRGLRALGGDIVNFVDQPYKTLVIPAIPQLNRSGKPLGHTLRILAPGDIDAQISVELISTKGRFIPVGLDSRVIKAGVVTQIALNPKLVPSKFALKITADRPILASTYSATFAQEKSDFLWSTSVLPMVEYSLAVSGLAPEFVFSGDNIAIALTVVYTNKKSKDFTIRGEGISTFQVPANVRSVIFNKVSEATYGGALVSTQSGYGFFPLTPGSTLTRALLPTANIRVLNP
jgi:hypothetical protein